MLLLIQGLVPTPPSMFSYYEPVCLCISIGIDNDHVDKYKGKQEICDN